MKTVSFKSPSILNFLLVVITVIVTTLISAFYRDVDLEKEALVIQEKIDSITKAHFEKNAIMFLSSNAENWYDIRDGVFAKLNKEEMIAPLQNYLTNMIFDELEPVSNPIIEISNDATLATYIGDATLKGRLDGRHLFQIFSWQSVFRKIDGDWKIISTANTKANDESLAKLILQKSIENLVDTNKISSINSLSTFANCTDPNGDHFKTLLLSSEDAARFEQADKRGNFIIKVGGDNSWSVDTNRGSFTENLDSTMNQMVYGHELHWLMYKPQTRYFDPIFKGFEEFEGQITFQIQFTDGLNRPVLIYYKYEDYRPVGFTVYISSVEIGEQVTVYFDDWEEKEGVQVFKSAVFKQDEKLFKYNFTEIKFNSLHQDDFNNVNAMIDF